MHNITFSPISGFISGSTNIWKKTTNHTYIGRTVLEDFKILVEENNMLNMNIS
jgi:hypothetical protein